MSVSHDAQNNVVVRKPQPSSNKKRSMTGHLKLLVSVIAITMSLFQLYTAAAGLLPPLQQRSAHLLFVLVLVFLLYPACRKSSTSKPGVLDWVLVALSLVSNAYLFWRYPSLARSGGLYVAADYIMGGIAMLVVFEASRRVLGWPLVILAAACLVRVCGKVGSGSTGPLRVYSEPSVAADVSHNRGSVRADSRGISDVYSCS